MSKKRVVVTGMGAITPIGIGIEKSFANLAKGLTGMVLFDKSKFVYDFKCHVGAPMPEEALSEEFHQKHKMQMDDIFYSQSNAIFKEAAAQAKLDFKSDNLPVDRDRIGLTISCLGEPLSNMLHLHKMRGGKLLTVTNFGLTGALALEYKLGGY